MSDAIIRRDVDSGWAWVALASCMVIGVLLAAFLTVIGIFQVEFLETFQGSQGLVALVCSVSLSSCYIYGPVAGIISDLVTHRVCIMVGSAMLCVGMVLASFCQDLISLLLVFGVVCGAGGGLCYIPSITVVSTYFQKYRTLANGICLAAPGVGIVGAPYLASWVVEGHGWRFAMVCFACLMAQICVLASMLYPHSPSPTPTCCRQTDKQRGAAPPRQGNSTEPDVTVQPASPNGCQKAGQKARLGAPAGSGSGSGLNVSEFGSMILSHASLRGSVEDLRSESIRQRVQHVLCQRFLWVMSLNQMLLDAGFSIHFILFRAYAQSVGLELRDLPPLYIMYGVTLTVSRIVTGLVFNLISRHWLKAFFAFRLGYAAMLFLLPLCGVNFPTIMVCQLFIGLTAGPCYTLLAPLLVRYLGLKNLSVAYGVTSLASGVGCVAGPPIAGVLYDIIGNYRICIFVAGFTVGTAALSLLLLLFLPNLQPVPERSVAKTVHRAADQRETLLLPSSQRETLLLPSSQRETLLLPSS